MALWTSENLVTTQIHGDMAEGQDFAAHFGPNNIPFGIASSAKHPSAQAVTRLGNKVVFLADLNFASQLPELKLPDGLFSHPTLNPFASLGRTCHRQVREAIQQLIHNNSLPEACQEPISAVQMHLPVAVGDYTDFSCSPSHNRKAGQALMGFPPNLPPGYERLPLGYAGRSSSIVVSGTSIKRPLGQFFKYGQEGLHGGRKEVVYGPSVSMDYELEMAVVVGKEVPLGDYVTAKEAGDHIFGFLLLNDWSARDFQQLEMIPVGPLTSKHAATSVSAWVITPDALAPFKTSQLNERAEQLAPHLDLPGGKQLSVRVSVAVDGLVQGKTDTKEMDWAFEQLIAHQSSPGCGMRPGDVLAIGTISGPGDDEQGCMLEQRVPGSTPRRDYLADGEQVQLVGYCGQGVGFGECTGQLLSSRYQSTWESSP